MMDRQFVSTALIPGIHGLTGSKISGYLLLGQTSLFSKVTHDFAIAKLQGKHLVPISYHVGIMTDIYYKVKNFLKNGTKSFRINPDYSSD